MASKIRVAISGGGVAGASLLYGLLQHPNIDAHIFESAAQFREAGVAFGINHSAAKTLDLMSGLPCLERAGGVPMVGVRFHLAEGVGAGEVVREWDTKRDGKALDGKALLTIVQRANLLHEFLAGVPAERMHASKKLVRAERRGDGGIVLHFADGTTHECDILIGADGIHSTVRKIVLGDDDPAAHPRNTGWWAIMTLQPYEKARSSIGSGPVDIDDAREMSWIGDGVFLLHNILSNGTIVQFSVCSKDENAEGKPVWGRKVGAEEIRRTFVSAKRPAHMNTAVEELLCNQPEQPIIYFYDHLHASTYASGGIAVMGDAAHATTPWQGSGGGICIEDSMILSSLLGQAKSPAEARVALKVYDQVRRPRTQRVVDSSYTTGQILMGQYEESGLDAEKLRKTLAPRWDFIFDFDNVRHREEALELMRKEVAASG